MGVEDLDSLVGRYLVSGDEAAIDEAVRAVRPRLVAVARRIVRAEEADDCAQTAFLSLLRKRGEGLDAPAWPWLVTAVVRIAYRRKAQERRQEEIARRLALPRWGQDPAREAVDAEERRLLREGIAALPDAYRDLLVLHDLEGLSAREAGSLLGLAEEAAKKRLQRGRALLRSGLPPRVAWALLALPWLAADAAHAAVVAGGVAMKKAAVLGILVALLALLAGTALQSWTGQDGGGARTGARLAREEATPAPSPASVPDTPRIPSAGGLVLGREGRPLPGARVVALPCRWRDAVDLAAVAPPLAAGIAGEDGRFSVPLLGGAPAHRLHVAARGYAPRTVSRVEDGAELCVRLRPAAALFGTVTDAELRPVPGARVRFLALVGGVRVEVEGAAGEEGRYRLEGLPDLSAFEEAEGSSGAWLEVTAEGFAPLLLQEGIVPREAEQWRDLVLLRGAVVQGRVLDGETRRPIAGARVLLVSDEGTGIVQERPGGTRVANPFVPRVLQECTADENGGFRMLRVPCRGFHRLASSRWSDAGEVIGCLRAVAEGRFGATEDLPAIEEGGTREIDLLCWPAGSVEGRVLDAAGRPVGGVEVWCHLPGRPLAWWTGRDREGGNPIASTDAEGRYRIDRVPAAATAKLIFRREGWPNRPDLPSTEIVIRAGSTTGVPDFVLGEAPAPVLARVQVVDDAGRPLFGATVSMAQVGGGAATDEAGVALLYGPPDHGAAPGPMRACVRAEGFAPALSPEFAPSDTAPVKVVLSRGRTIEGRVQWSDGSPAPGSFITAVDGSLPPELAFERLYEPPPPLRLLQQTRVDGDGAFRLAGLPDGPVHIRAWHPFGEAIAPAAPGMALVYPAVRPGLARLEGTVEDESGRRPLRCSARLKRADVILEASFPAPGCFRFDEVPEGEWRLEVRAAGLRPAEIGPLAIRAGGPPVSVRLEGGAVASGKVVNRTTLDLRAAQVLLLGEEQEMFLSQAIGESGAWRIAGLKPGRYWPLVILPGQGLRSRGVAVRDPACLEVADASVDRTLDLEVVEGGQLAITGHAPLAPGARAELRVEDAEGRLLLRRTGAAALSAWTHVLPEGPCTLTWTVEGVVRPIAKAEVAIGRPAFVKIPKE